MQGLDLRHGVAGLNVLAKRDLNALWGQVNDAAGATAALHDILPALIDTYGLAAASLAADWYDTSREKAGIGGSFRAIAADIKEPGAQALIGWALNTATDYSAFQGLVAGGTQRRIANFSRGTVTGSSIHDPKARGWARVGSGECDFCSMLLDRGAVYTQATSDFLSHDNCNCQAVPAFDA